MAFIIKHDLAVQGISTAREIQVVLDMHHTSKRARHISPQSALQEVSE